MPGPQPLAENLFAGGDESVGMALVLLQFFSDDEGSLDNMPSGAVAGKSSARTRLEWILKR